MTDARLIAPPPEIVPLKEEEVGDYRPSVCCGVFTLIFVNGWILFVYFIGKIISDQRGHSDGDAFVVFMSLFPLGFTAFFFFGVACPCQPRSRHPLPKIESAFALSAWLIYFCVILMVSSVTCGNQMVLDKTPVHRNVTLGTISDGGVVSFNPHLVNSSIFGVTFDESSNPVYALFMSSDVVLTTNSLSVPISSVDGMTWAKSMPINDVLFRAITDMRIRWPSASNVSVPLVLRFFDYLSDLQSVKGHCQRSTTAFWVGFAVFNPLFIAIYIVSVKRDEVSCQ